MQIPKRFKLNGKLHTVQLVPKMERRGTMGYFDRRKCLVTIAQQSTLSDRVFKQEEVADTFWHEVVHAILFDMDHRLATNEEFVTRFSRRLNEIVHTAEL
jgi:hypothetical protein